MITDEDKERVRQATDFVTLVSETVELKPRGQDYWGCCPFHQEKSPSFKINPSTGLWHCFGACSEGGDVFSYVMKRENLDFPDAIRYLADKAGITLSEEAHVSKGPRKNRLIECLTEAENYFHSMLMRGRGEGPETARAYLSGRGFGAGVCKRWKLGYAPGRGALVAHLRKCGFTTQEMVAANLAVERNGRISDWFYDRVMFPIHDEQGRTIAFGGRITKKVENAPKYLNTRDTTVFNKGKHLFAYDVAKETIAAQSEAIICEGYTDVIAMHEAGFTNTVAALGTAFTSEHVKLIDRQRARKIICMFDGDAAGQHAAARVIKFIDKTTAAFLCVVLPNNQDPMEFLAESGAEKLRPILDSARPLMDFVFDATTAEFDLSVPGGRVKALEALASLLAPLKTSVLLSEYALRVADLLHIDAEEAKRAIKAAPIQDDASNFRTSKSARKQSQKMSYNTSNNLTYTKSPVYVEAPSYDEVPPYDEASTYDVPADVRVPSGTQGLSAEDRRQVNSELELLSAMATNLSLVREYQDRIADFVWADARHQTMAWAMLATPEGATPAQVVAAAVAVEPNAAAILSSGRVISEGNSDTRRSLEFIVDTVDYYSVQRKLREIRSNLRSGSYTGEQSDETLAEEQLAAAQALQTRALELGKRLTSGQ
ncbi:DNA primase [Lancefieldella parvula DSM 20469]|uniref:DNA primase n=1 Tax=Lancefieldella parvula (strain ATCC 33793 / DSM 20469 / CCUG 32760 / JCM 10300 / KCTC 3663 / VPI 0546 / 1246) TaxID=521095 RepID=C8W714_LANP1|nr:DNA primase [Lancefieldella parvula]ACV51254.1 DNA primase [Lancefieldella parvula DSM 20469]